MLLSFYIPTYNRPKDLDRLLDSLTSQLKIIRKYWGEVEIVVSDNASSVDIKSIVQKYDQNNQNLSIVFSKNATNKGADANILDCFFKTTGSYVWLLCDDDLIYDNAIERVLQIITTSNYGFFRLGETIENTYGTIISPLDKIYEQSDFEIKTELVLSLYGPTLLRGSCLVLRRPSNNELGPISISMGSNRSLSPLTLALDAMLEYKKGLGVSGKCIRYVDANKESWLHLWPWISSICIPLAIIEFCTLNKIPRKSRQNIISEIVKSNQSLAAVMLLNRKYWPPNPGDWKFIFIYYLLRPSFLPVLILKMFSLFFKFLLPNNVITKVRKKFNN
jgi:glycosyltransferase involved in cell wall biosynthesis